MSEVVDIVNEKDEVVRQQNRDEVIKNKLLHRAVGVFVFNAKGQLYVHQRGFKKKTYHGFWGVGAGGAVNAGESYDDAIKRELKEELGIKDVEIEFLYNYNYKSDISNYNGKIYKCVYNGKIKLNKDEFEQGQWVDFDKMQDFMKTHQFCPDIIEYFKIYVSGKWKKK